MFSQIIWNKYLRLILFWGLVAGATLAASKFWKPFNVDLISETALKAYNGKFEGLSEQDFAFALAASLGVLAGALALAILVMHALWIPFSLRLARRPISAQKDMVSFAAAYEDIHRKLARHPLLGHAWKEFDETLVKPRDEREPIRNTVRPQSFVNIGIAREKLFALKMMSSLPGYFVGIGLLLTFIGLVLALHKAAAGVSSEDAKGMQAATRELLQVATFKFSTSIAGLGASIALSFLLRIYAIFIEGAFEKFCHAVEAKLRYTAPQSITAEMNEHMAEQVVELKQINSADFFSRMGEQLSPQIQSAFSAAIAPVTTAISDAMDQISKTSQTGVTDLVQQFTNNLNSSAGTELKELANTLRGMQATLADAQKNIHGTGEDFGRRLTEAAENLNRLMGQAGDRLSQSSDESRQVLNEIVSALKSTSDQALTDVRKVVETASDEAGSTIRDGMSVVIEAINEQFAAFTAAMQTASQTIADQVAALENTTIQSRAIADAFGKTAQDVRAASTPLVQSGERIANATDKLSEIVRATATTLITTNDASKELAGALQTHIKTVSETWAQYSERFAKVDADLGRSFEQLHDATIRQGQLLSDYAKKVDEGLASAVQKLSPLMSGLEDSAGSLSDSVDDLKKVFTRAAAE
ncbi:anti-phage ZorAB system protein ZorA [Taklimakanibacter lacteus]|uniref:anti-phage ZorAB system protein ZorA n=1 Tax=Taklimakanibacter lacteus TaxID=2268456 RepID=UPI000E66F585